MFTKLEPGYDFIAVGFKALQQCEELLMDEHKTPKDDKFFPQGERFLMVFSIIQNLNNIPD